MKQIYIVKQAVVGVAISLLSLTAHAVEEILVWDRLQDNQVANQILQLAMDKTVETHGDYKLVTSYKMEQDRVVEELKSGDLVHVGNFAPTAAREKALIPIRIPVTQGLLGYRVCLIDKQNQANFDGIQTKQDWLNRGVSIGQGKGWPDTEILLKNDLPVVQSTKYLPLFSMLKQGRFDCFSRSVSEVMPELENHPELAIEKNILLVYRLPTFFFVSPKQPALATRIEKGLQKAYDDGSVAKIIREHYDPVFEKLGFDQRVQILLDNPYLTPETQKALSAFSGWLKRKD